MLNGARSASQAPARACELCGAYFQPLDALNMIEAARTHILNCEYELAAICARVDSIENVAVPREEMKPWLKEE